jgi:hypothetical protein
MILSGLAGMWFIRKWNRRRRDARRGFAVEPIAHLPQA